MSDLNLQFARNCAEFCVEFFQKLAAGGIKENIIFSPFSVQSCVALAFAGAHGDTAKEIATVLKFTSNSAPEVAKTFQYVLENYKNSELLKIANKICVQQGKVIKPEYANLVKTHFQAETEELDFNENEAAAASINDWVEQKTAGKITELVSADCFDSMTRMVLLNALHFKGQWAKKFDQNQTIKDDFWISSEESVQLEYMTQKSKFGYGYFDNLNCTALEMPYENSDLSMFVLLPGERDGLKSLAEQLKEVNLVDLAAKMHQEEVAVKFPKFTVSYQTELSDILKRMGTKLMFTDTAEFGNMLESPEDLHVSKVLHKACIEVNEEGTEAAASTGIIMMTRMMLLPTQFIADHPFLYMIWNKRNILFAGAFVNAPDA
uniref:Serine protease inhibitor (serpin) 10 n=1 Tax=Glossina morsitans morsitans TaxID=37546 RepID=H9TZT6_GLOMM|nr:Serp2 [Glossina morsitans morsitans]